MEEYPVVVRDGGGRETRDFKDGVCGVTTDLKRFTNDTCFPVLVVEQEET